MTISSTNSRMDYIGNDAVKTYAYNFSIFSAGDLLLTVRGTDDIETTLVNPTDYTVDLDSSEITLVNASQAWLTSGFLKDGFALSIRRKPALTQLTDIRNQGQYFPETHENAFDHFIQIDQAQQDEIDRSVKFPETVDPVLFDTKLPADLIGNPGASVVVNDTGDGFKAGPMVTDVEGAANSAEDAAASAIDAAASAAAAADSAAEAANAVVGDLVSLYKWGGSAGGTANALTLTPSPALEAYANGQLIGFIATATNTLAATVAVSGLTAKSLKTQSGAAVSAGEIVSGRLYLLNYDGTNFIIHDLATPEDGSITNAKIAVGAAIAYAKLALTGAILDADLAGSISNSKLSTINTAGKVSGASLTSLSSIPSGAGRIPIVNLATGSPTGSKFIRDDGSLQTPSFSSPAYVVGDYLTASADTEQSDTPGDGVWVKVKEILLPRGGALRIKFDLKALTISNNGQAKVYRNGSPVGTLATTNIDNEYHTEAEDISGWSSGDLCQLYISTDDGTTETFVQNFRLYEGVPLDARVLLG